MPAHITGCSMPSRSVSRVRTRSERTTPGGMSAVSERRMGRAQGNVDVMTASAPLVGVIMGSDSDLDVMQGALDVLEEFGVPHEVRIVSAHRTPDVMVDYARGAADRGLRVIIAGAGGAAHLPGMTASMTSLPV